MSDCNSNPTSGCTDNSTATQIKIMNGKILPLFVNLEAAITALGEAMLDCCEASGEKIDDINDKLETIIENNSDCCTAILSKIGQIGQILDVIEAGGVPCVSTTTTTAEPCYKYTITNTEAEVAFFSVLYCDGTTDNLSLAENESIVVCLQEAPTLIIGSINISKGGTCTGTIITTTTTVAPPTTTTSTTSAPTTTTTTSGGTTTTTTTSEVTTTTTTLLVEINCDEDMLMTFWSRQPAEANTWEAYIELPVPAPDTYIFRVSFSATRNDVPDTISSYLDVTISEGDYVGQKLDGTPAYHVANIVGEDWTVTSFEISSVTPDDGIFVYEACLTTTTTTPPD